MRALLAQARAELAMTLRRGDAVLLAMGIPLVLLVFFSEAPVLSLPGRHRVDFVAPGVLALCVMSTSLVSLGIATGFERSRGILKRLRVTPLGTPRLLGAKVLATLCVEALQVLVVAAVALGIGWRPSVGAAALLGAIGAAVVCSAGLGAIGLASAGRLSAEGNLAALNGAYLVLLLISGIVLPLSRLPGALASVARALPSGALAASLRAALSSGHAPTWSQWLVLAAWALGASALAAACFRYEPNP